MTDHGPCVIIPLSLFESLELDASHQSSAALMRDTPGERQYWKGFLKAIETMRLLAGVDPTINLDSSLQRVLPGIELSTHKLASGSDLAVTRIEPRKMR